MKKLRVILSMVLVLVVVSGNSALAAGMSYPIDLGLISGDISQGETVSTGGSLQLVDLDGGHFVAEIVTGAGIEYYVAHGNLNYPLMHSGIYSVRVYTDESIAMNGQPVYQVDFKVNHNDLTGPVNHESTAEMTGYFELTHSPVVPILESLSIQYGPMMANEPDFLNLVTQVVLASLIQGTITPDVLGFMTDLSNVWDTQFQMGIPDYVIEYLKAESGVPEYFAGYTFSDVELELSYVPHQMIYAPALIDQYVYSGGLNLIFEDPYIGTDVDWGANVNAKAKSGNTGGNMSDLMFYGNLSEAVDGNSTYSINALLDSEVYSGSNQDLVELLSLLDQSDAPPEDEVSMDLYLDAMFKAYDGSIELFLTNSIRVEGSMD